jgi:hypothetical protein
MFSFPVNLQDNGIQKFTNDADSGFPKIQQREIFYTVKDGNWNDLTIWQTASGRVGKLPSPDDAVYIRYGHTIVYNVLDTTTAPLSQDSGGVLPNVVSQINSLYVFGTLNWGGNNWYRLVVLNKLRVSTTGVIDMTPSNASGNNASFWICGTDNEFLGTFIPATSGQAYVAYWGGQNKTILSSINYNDLRLYGYEPSNAQRVTQSVISLNSNLTIGGSLNINPTQTPTIFDTSFYNLIVNGTTTITQSSTLRASGNGSLLFIGAFLSSIATPSIGINLEFTGNPNVEFRGGFNVTNTNVGFVGTTGTGTWSFTTNNQSISISAPQTFNCKVLIGSGVTLTRTNTGSAIALNLNDTINGVDGTSKLLMGLNSPVLNFATDISVPSMTTGIVDFTTNANTIGYTGNYSATIPSYFTTFYNLTISGTGTKTLSVNTTLNASLTVASGTFQLSTFNLTVSGNTTINNATLSKTGAGSLLFVGLINFPNTGGLFDFSVGNPTVEIRGGITYNLLGNPHNTGTGLWTFSTNSQALSFSTSVAAPIFNCPILISGAITLTIGSGASTTTTLNNYINGDNAASKLLMGASFTLNFATQIAAENSMTTGIVDFTTNANTIQFGGNYSATIPSRFPTFYNLTISGTGTKTLSVNTTLNGALTLSTTGGLLNCSTFNLTVTGVTNFQNGGLQKTGAGNLLFIGNFNSVTGNNSNKIDFSGNPNVELRGGITRGNYDWNGGWNTGTGTWTFTTNNQTFEGAAGYTMPCTCKFIVSGAISVTFTNGQQTTFADRIDGTAAGSTWINQGRMRFTGTEITPMATGVFNYLTSSLSYLMYEYAGTQTIPYTSYQGFGIAGVGFTKTLSGTTSVSQNFEFNSGTLECSTYNLSVTGNTTANGIISKTGAGSLLFVGNLLWGGTSGAGNSGGFNLTGNPTLEFRGGITYGTYGMYSATNTGTGQMTFSTNAQTINLGRTSGSTITLNNNILISGAIIVTLNNGTTNTLLAGSINGDNASSTLRIAASATTNYQNATQPMATGILDTSTNLNTWIYGLNNQNIKGGPTTLAKQVYRNLTLNGTGVKTLQGYVSVLNTYTLTSPATLALNGFTLTNP